MLTMSLMKAAAIALAMASATLPAAALTDYDPTTAETLPSGNAACGAERVRKSWDACSAEEKALVNEATAMAIENGVMEIFTEVHMEAASQAQAHLTCAFFTWHRRYVLAFENYLRSLDDRFACLTLPYYDIHTSYVNAANGECSSMLDCSDVFEGQGGAEDRSAGVQTMVYNGRSCSGYKVSGTPFTNSCDDNGKCGYTVRNMEGVAVPSGGGWSSFVQMVSGSADYATFMQAIQYGVHNEVHNGIGGSVQTLAAPRDPAFWSWHVAIDMFYSVFHLCKFGAPLTESQAKTSDQAFAKATQSCGGTAGITPESVFIQLATNKRTTTIDVEQIDSIKEFFTAVDDQMWSFSDTRNLGDYSYTYSMPQMYLNDLLMNEDLCPLYAEFISGLDSSESTSASASSSFGASFHDSFSASKPASSKASAEASAAASTEASAAASTEASAEASASTGASTGASTSASTGASTAASTGASTGGDVDSAPGSSANSAVDSGNNGAVKDSTAGSSSKLRGSSSGDATGEVGDESGSSITVPSDDLPDAGLGSTGSGVNIPTTHPGFIIESGSGSGGKGTSLCGNYGNYLQKTYEGLKDRFNGDMEIVGQQMQIVECMIHEKMFGLTKFSPLMIEEFHLASETCTCGKKVEAVESGNLTVVVDATEFEPSCVEFGSDEDVEKVKDEFVPMTVTNDMVNTSYIPIADKLIEDAEAGITSAEGSSPDAGDSDYSTPAATGVDDDSDYSAPASSGVEDESDYSTPAPTSDDESPATVETPNSDEGATPEPTTPIADEGEVATPEPTTPTADEGEVATPEPTSPTANEGATSTPVSTPEATTSDYVTPDATTPTDVEGESDAVIPEATTPSDVEGESDYSTPEATTADSPTAETPSTGVENESDYNTPAPTQVQCAA